MIFELHLRAGDFEVVGEFDQYTNLANPHAQIPFIPPMGSIVEVHGIRFSVSDVVTRLDPICRVVMIECFKIFDTDEEHEAALHHLAQNGVKFDEEVLDYIAAMVPQEET